MPESHSAREAILWSAEYCHTYADHCKNRICKVELSKTKGKEIAKKKLDRSSLMFCLYITSYITDQLYYKDMNWRYNTLLLPNCKGSFIVGQELQWLLASLLLSSPIACKLGWQVMMAVFSFRASTAVLATEVTKVGKPFLLSTHRTKYTGDKEQRSLEFYSSTLTSVNRAGRNFSQCICCAVYKWH